MKIGGTNNVNGPRRIYAQGQKPSENTPPVGSTDGDRVEISQAARISEAISRLPDVRADKVNRARQMIADGTMDTPERWNVAIDRLIDDAATTFEPL